MNIGKYNELNKLKINDPKVVIELMAKKEMKDEQLKQFKNLKILDCSSNHNFS
jgi:hypothetical protein